MAVSRSHYESLTVYLVALATVLADQFSKAGVAAALPLGRSVPLIDGVLHLTYVQNFGAAFSLFWGHGEALVVIALLVTLGVVIYQRRVRPKELLPVLSLGFLLGGALGNMIDRIAFGYVRDMVDLQWHGQNIWPIFNLADMAILLGSVLIVLHSLRAESASKQGEKIRSS